MINREKIENIDNIMAYNYSGEKNTNIHAK